MVDLDLNQRPPDHGSERTRSRPILRIDLALERKQVERLVATRSKRDSAAVESL